jgi:hypothetical protein
MNILFHLLTTSLRSIAKKLSGLTKPFLQIFRLLSRASAVTVLQFARGIVLAGKQNPDAEYNYSKNTGGAANEA